MARLIICADDYALNPSVNQAILQLILSDKLTATSCMVKSPIWSFSAQHITAEIQHKAAIGLHLDLTEFAQHLCLTQLMWQCLSATVNRAWLQREIREQLDLFEQALGRAPDYIDGHQHVHQFPIVRHLLVQEIRQRYPKQTPWLRIARPANIDSLKSWLIRGMGANTLKQMAQQSGIRCSDYLLGIYRFNLSETEYRQTFKAWIQQASQLNNSVLMCHPALANSDANQDAIAQARSREFAVLNQMDIVAYAKALHLTLSKAPA